MPTKPEKESTGGLAFAAFVLKLTQRRNKHRPNSFLNLNI